MDGQGAMVLIPWYGTTSALRSLICPKSRSFFAIIAWVFFVLTDLGYIDSCAMLGHPRAVRIVWVSNSANINTS